MRISDSALLAFFAAIALVNPARAADKPATNRRTGLFEPPMSDLRKAAERGDRAELARAAGRVGPARLAKALADPDPRTVLAALEGIALLPSAILLVDEVASQVASRGASSDPAIRSRAVRTLSVMLAGSDSGRLAELEVPAESTRAACQTLSAVAVNEKEGSPLRLSAVQALADAGATCTASFNPSQLLAARDPELRRAAVLALPISPEANNLLLASTKDGDSRVAAAAGARLCSRQAKGRAMPMQPPLGKLALADGAAVEDVIEMLPCLTGSKEPGDGKALETLRESGPAVVRDAINVMGNPGRISAPHSAPTSHPTTPALRAASPTPSRDASPPAKPAGSARDF